MSNILCYFISISICLMFVGATITEADDKIDFSGKSNISNIERDKLSSRFSKAYDLIHSVPPKYKEALQLLEQNIEEADDSGGIGGIDYYYAWAMFCYAKLKDYHTAFKYYRILRELHEKYCFSSGSFHGSWDWICFQVQDELQGSNDSSALSILKAMMEFDRDRALRFQKEVIKLIKLASAGNPDAVKALKKFREYDLVIDFLPEGLLTFSDNTKDIYNKYGRSHNGLKCLLRPFNQTVKNENYVSFRLDLSFEIGSMKSDIQLLDTYLQPDTIILFLVPLQEGTVYKLKPPEYYFREHERRAKTWRDIINFRECRPDSIIFSVPLDYNNNSITPGHYNVYALYTNIQKGEGLPHFKKIKLKFWNRYIKFWNGHIKSNIVQLEIIR